MQNNTSGRSFLAASIACLISLSAPAAAAAPPDVLMIAIDDLNDWVGCLHGHPQAMTPHLDRVAARGTLFANAHCQAPLCNPSRTSLLTGLRPSTTGIYGLMPGFREVERTRNVVTLPQHFQAAGYWTYACGKVFHDGSLKPATRAQEFSEWGPAPGMPRPPKKFVDTPSKMWAVDWGVFPPDDREQADWKIADAAVDAIRRAPADKPFFISCGFRLPHVPCFASQHWYDLIPAPAALPPWKPDDRDDVPPFAWYLHWQLPEPRLSWLQKHAQWEPLVRSYLACTTFMDSQLGRVMDALASSPRASNTVVVIWSDHGWHLGEKAITGKNSLWDRSTRVPLLFAGPGVTAGQVCRRPAELLDIYPTLVDLCGLDQRKDIEGISLKPQLVDAAAPRERPAITTHNPGNHTARTEKWRYIRYADGSEELYDMESDPNEWTNLARDGKHAGVIGDLARWLPATSAPLAPGSAARTLEKRGDTWYWEGKPISPDELDL